MPFERKSKTLIAENRAKLAGKLAEIERLNNDLAAGVGRAPNTTQIKVAIELLEIDINELRATLELLEARGADEERAAVAKRRAQQIGRVEALLVERAKLGPKIEKKIDELLDLIEEKVEFDKRIMPAWPFNTSDTEILKPWAQGARELLCYEFYRKSALRFINTPGAITLPGSVCEKDVWRLQPHLIPSLSKRLQDIAEYGSRVMRGGRSTVQPKQLEKAS